MLDLGEYLLDWLTCLWPICRLIGYESLLFKVAENSNYYFFGDLVNLAPTFPYALVREFYK